MHGLGQQCKKRVVIRTVRAQWLRLMKHQNQHYLWVPRPLSARLPTVVGEPSNTYRQQCNREVVTRTVRAQRLHTATLLSDL